MELSHRIMKVMESPSPILSAHLKCIQDLYHKDKNPNGYLSLGTSENHLSWDLLQEKISTSGQLMESDIHYNISYGIPEVRETIANFVEHFFNQSFDPENIIISNGVTAIINMWAFAFCDPNDVVLIPSPYYPGFKTDLELQAQVQVKTIPTTSEGGFQLNYQDIVKAHEEATAQGKKVRGIILTSPGNPVGRNLSSRELEDVAKYLLKYKTLCLFDEIYALTDFSEGSKVCRHKDFIDKYPELKPLVHWTYGLSKDLGLAGLRVGFFHSFSKEHCLAMKSLSYFNHIPTDTQRLVINLLSDHQWLESSFQVIRKRLKNAHQSFYINDDIPIWKAEGGFFAWMDASHYLQENNFESEARLNKEILSQAKINILPGQYFEASDPGWFRACLARPNDFLEIAISRLRSFFEERAPQ